MCSHLLRLWLASRCCSGAAVSMSEVAFALNSHMSRFTHHRRRRQPMAGDVYEALTAVILWCVQVPRSRHSNGVCGAGGREARAARAAAHGAPAPQHRPARQRKPQPAAQRALLAQPAALVRCRVGMLDGMSRDLGFGRRVYNEICQGLASVMSG